MPGKIDEAIEAHERSLQILEELTEKFGTAPHFRHSLGIACSNYAYLLATLRDATRVQRERAVVLARRSVQLDPRVPSRHRNLGIALVETRQWENAIQALEAAVAKQRRTRPPLASHYLALAYWHSGDKKRARESWRLAKDEPPPRSVREQPAFRTMQQRLARLFESDEAIGQ